MTSEQPRTHEQSTTMVAGMTSVRTVEQTRMGIAALLVSNIGWGMLPLYWHELVTFAYGVHLPIPANALLQAHRCSALRTTQTTHRCA